jgi:RNA polymerase sigma-70 factor (ECF subfamily)
VTKTSAVAMASANAIGATDINRAMASVPGSSARSSEDAAEHARLWDRHARRIYRFCFRRTADRELAEDLTSIVFLEAWRHRREMGTTTESELPWLYGVAANVLRNQWRSQRRYRAALARLPRPRDDSDLAQEAVDRVADQQRMAQLVEKLRALPQIEQDVLSLCAWEDLTPKETAAALGIPEATVRTRLHRARRRLRALDETSESTRLAGLERVEGEGS